MMAAPNLPSQRRTDDANHQEKEDVGCANYNAVAKAEAGKVCEAVSPTLQLFRVRVVRGARGPA